MAKKKTAGRMIRQGDVLVQFDAGEDGGKEIPADSGRAILAYGEVTGHAHALPSEVAALFDFGDFKALELKAPAFLRHEEHKALQIPVGKHRVTVQREYRYGSATRVAD